MFLDLESTEVAALDSFNVSVLVAINDVIFFQPVWKRDRSRVCASCPSVVSEMAITLLHGRISLCLDGHQGF